MSLHCKCSSFLLNESKLANFLRRNFGITEFLIKEVSPQFINPEKRRNSSFKISLHRNAGIRLLSADSKKIWSKFNILVGEWSDKNSRKSSLNNSNNALLKPKVTNSFIKGNNRNYLASSDHSSVLKRYTVNSKTKKNTTTNKNKKIQFTHTPAIKTNTSFNPLFSKKNLNFDKSINLNTNTKTFDDNFSLRLNPNIFPTSPTKILRYPNFVQGESIVPGVSYPISSPLRTYASTAKLKVQPNEKGKVNHKTPIIEKSDSEVPEVSPVKTSRVEDAVKTNNTTFINPLVPPKVRHTQNALHNSESLYDLSRLREKTVLENVRLYLAYLHDNPSACIYGKTKMNVSVQLLAEGLPNSLNELRKLYFKYHEGYGMSEKSVQDELATYRSYLRSERTSYLQKVRENESKWFRPLK